MSGSPLLRELGEVRRSAEADRGGRRPSSSCVLPSARARPSGSGRSVLVGQAASFVAALSFSSEAPRGGREPAARPRRRTGSGGFPLAFEPRVVLEVEARAFVSGRRSCSCRRSPEDRAAAWWSIVDRPRCRAGRCSTLPSGQRLDRVEVVRVERAAVRRHRLRYRIRRCGPARATPTSRDPCGCRSPARRRRAPARVWRRETRQADRRVGVEDRPVPSGVMLSSWMSACWPLPALTVGDRFVGGVDDDAFAVAVWPSPVTTPCHQASAGWPS